MPPVIVVYSLPQAAAALAAAAELGREIKLLSPPAAAISAGAAWWSALVAAARAAVPGSRFTALLDCDDDAGAAQAALRAGVAGIVFTGDGRAAEALADIALQQNALFLARRPAPTIDLMALFFSDAAAVREHCSRHLRASG